MSYVDGFVVPVPTTSKDAYREMAALAAKVFKENGAISVMEAWEDEVPDGQTTDFRRAVKIEAGEAVVFSWVLWPSKEVRDAGMKTFMEDERLKANFQAMPFDGKRMIFGGFAPIVEA
ncbi:DUF1428 domain-containing protein [Enterovirga rhinocerotis]|uniref:Uncharacterized protein YbaA (DUF1428 family) n=1 Tax=Enterovirga rhinocerotis TaxID=1339210 RepID=A0A4V3DZ24_9HYPH|nr:DUF1428 domain-containing protein [Enterovirga rhinocerotis]TDR94909.1 uncharacterized protein YbaA (DUF1428 family) [Enterovirga rhinocerotis]